MSLVDERDNMLPSFSRSCAFEDFLCREIAILIKPTHIINRVTTFLNNFTKVETEVSSMPNVPEETCTLPANMSV